MGIIGAMTIHTRNDEKPGGFPGKMGPVKVTVIGAGSGFTPHLIGDLMRVPGSDRGEIALVDIDRKRLATMHKIITKMAAGAGKPGWKVVSDPDRRRMMRGTDYLINTIEVSGVQCVRLDNDIPLKYRVDQCIGDTIGPGGLFKGLRTIPVWLDILHDAERLCPRALVLNYTNPMTMHCLAAARASSMQVVGLCHSVQWSSWTLAWRAKVPLAELEYDCAGINHLAWFTKVRHRRRNLYPLLMRKAARDLAGHRNPGDRWDLVRKDVMLHFGAYVTESSGHLSEYLPYYRKNRAALKRYCGPAMEGESRYYARNWPSWRREADRERELMLRGKKELPKYRTFEFASWIIEAIEKGRTFHFNGSVPNRRRDGTLLIDNLMPEGVVEVRCRADRNGVTPLKFGRLPAQMAALCESNLRMFDLAADAAIKRSKELAILALTLDPLTAAVCTPAQARKMALEMFDAERKFLPGYR